MRRVESRHGMAPNRAVLIALVALTGCAASGPRTFRFASNLAHVDGRACVLRVLRRHGFGIEGPAGEGDALVAMRAPVRTAEGPGAWWRVEASFESDPDGRTVVTSLLSASPREEGPFTTPPDLLEEVGSEITARCMWGPR